MACRVSMQMLLAAMDCARLDADVQKRDTELEQKPLLPF